MSAPKPGTEDGEMTINESQCGMPTIQVGLREQDEGTGVQTESVKVAAAMHTLCDQLTTFGERAEVLMALLLKQDLEGSVVPASASLSEEDKWEVPVHSMIGRVSEEVRAVNFVLRQRLSALCIGDAEMEAIASGDLNILTGEKQPHLDLKFDGDDDSNPVVLPSPSIV